MINELEIVALTVDLPEYRLKAGDTGTVVFVHGAGQGYQVEFMTLRGDTIAVVPVTPAQIRLVGATEIASARVMSGA